MWGVRNRIAAIFAQNMFQADVFTIAGWIPGASTMTSLEEVRVPSGQAEPVKGLSNRPGRLSHTAVCRKDMKSGNRISGPPTAVQILLRAKKPGIE
jgi:hypothetical protein